MTDAAQPLLQVRDLRVALQTPRGPALALRGLDFAIARGKTLGLMANRAAASRSPRWP